MNFIFIGVCVLFATISNNVVAATLTKASDQYETKGVTTHCEDMVLNVRYSDVTTHSIMLSWSHPSDLLDYDSYKISFDATKEFIDAQGIPQTAVFPQIEIILKQDTTSYVINQLSPFTTYNINVTAIPSCRPAPIKIKVKTQMAAPKPMHKPDYYGVINEEKIQVILPQASEEYGPISHYYLIVIPENKQTIHRFPDSYLTNEIMDSGNENPDDPAVPYIAAKFSNRIPHTFILGTGDEHYGFKNRKLERGMKYRIFVRAVVATDENERILYTSSPFSNSLSLDMSPVP